MADTVLRYVRGTKYVKNLPKAPEGGNAKPAHGLVGELWVGGLCFDTLERMDGYVKMEGDQDYANSTMYWHSKYKSYVVNPYLGREAEATKKKNILMHPAAVPSHLEGCVGIGFLESGKLTTSRESFTLIWKTVGGGVGNTSQILTVTLRVEGKMPSLATCTAWAG